MNSEKKTEIKVGITALLAIIIFIFVYGWAKDFSFNSEYKRLKVSFPTAAGLEIGDLVSVNGVRKGLVESIQTGNNEAVVEIKFTDNIDIYEDAQFSIMMLDLMGGKKIEIYAGSSQNRIDHEILHYGKFAGDISTAMATLSSVESDLIDLVQELRISLKSANSVIGDKNFTNNLSHTVANLNILTNNLNDMVIQNKNLISETLKNTRNLTKNANELIIENRDEISVAIKNLNSTLASSADLIDKLSVISSEVKSSENNLGKLLYDEELMSDVKISLKQLKELSTIINEQLKSDGLKVKADVDLF